MNVIEKVKALIPQLRGRSLNQIFPPNITQNFQFQRVRKGYCINQYCRRNYPLSKEEMFPSGRATPRALCSECWNYLAKIYAEECWVCGEYLEGGKVNAQRSNPYDIHTQIHDLICADWFSLVSAKALGFDMSFLKDDHFGNAQNVSRGSQSHQLPQQGQQVQQVPQQVFQRQPRQLRQNNGEQPYQQQYQQPHPQNQQQLQQDPGEDYIDVPYEDVTFEDQFDQDQRLILPPSRGNLFLPRNSRVRALNSPKKQVRVPSTTQRNPRAKAEAALVPRGKKRGF